jgi:hypothetical protein
MKNNINLWYLFLGILSGYILYYFCLYIQNKNKLKIIVIEENSAQNYAENYVETHIVSMYTWISLILGVFLIAIFITYNKQILNYIHKFTEKIHFPKMQNN